ncbi:MAG TPA: ATPase, T2SS/T4P/T4SS family [Pirellulales bacterium]|nr:ATPase, T2SS/T4P/T4SS family [Pirellulales bacterium]
MSRWAALIFGCVALAIIFWSPPRAPAQPPVDAPAVQPEAGKGWPHYPLPAATQFGKDPSLGRGQGFYLSLSRFFLMWILFLLWVKTADWVSQDCLRLDMTYMVWNSVMFGPFVAAFFLMWLLPWFEVAYPLMAVAYLAPLGVYIIIRNKGVDSHQRVLTPDHLRHVFAAVAGKVGVKVSTERQLDHEKGAPVKFKATAGGGRDGEANLLLARRSPGYVASKDLVADMLDRRGDAIMLECTAANVGVRFQIDGVWHNVDPRDNNSGNMIVAVLKTMAGLDANERAKRQSGTLAADYQGHHYFCKLQSVGVENGERVVAHFHPTKAPVHTLEELGLRAKTQEQLKQLLARTSGFVVFSSMPYGGLSNLFDAALKVCDRYVRDFAAVEDVNNREHEIENLQVTTYNAAAGETPVPALEKIIRTYPNALVVRSLTDGPTAKLLCEQVKEDRLILAGMRSKDAPETLLRVLLLKVPPKDFVNAVSGVICVRLVRKLCDACKEGYPAPAEILQQFGIPPGKVQTLFRTPSQVDPKKPCPQCQGIGYKGRTGLFELLVVDDGVREVLMKSPKLDLVRAASRKGGMKTFQEEGLVLVVKGVTSLLELQRVLKG